MKNKILITRFSSIGDIVLTSPVIRCLKEQLKNVEIHFLCKERFKETLIHNPNIDICHFFENNISEVISTLKSENFNYVIDLHNNVRSLKLKLSLGKKAYTFKKVNVKKAAAVLFKKPEILPKTHIVQRYLETVSALGVKDDGKGLDYFIGKEDAVNLKEKFPLLISRNFIALVVGGSYHTKQIPLNKLIEICSKTNKQFIALGGKEDEWLVNELIKKCSNVINACGELSLNQSASVIQQSELVITSDTGLMHIAAAFGKKIISFWGNTIPEFGMYPYKPNPENKIMEVKNLKCRPCSKLGFKKCPKQHFNCMNMQDVSSLNL